MYTHNHHVFDMKWQGCKTSLNNIIASDAVRRERVNVCSLEGNNETLEHQLETHLKHISSLEHVSRELRDSLDAGSHDVDVLRSDLLSRNYDLENLKAELSSLRTASGDFTSPALDPNSVNELSSLRLEVELLRSQENAHKKALSEKRALQLQLSSVEIELETERRNNVKRHKVEVAAANSDASLVIELDQEKRSRQKIEMEFQKAAEERQREDFVHQQQLERLQSELQQAKQKLQIVDDRNLNVLDHTRSSKAVSFDMRSRPSKPSLVEISANIDLPTPNAGTEGLRAKHLSTEPGLQSEFSTTPFLKRTDKLPLHRRTASRGAVEQEQHDSANREVRVQRSDKGEGNRSSKQKFVKAVTKGSAQPDQDTIRSVDETGFYTTSEAIGEIKASSSSAGVIETEKLLNHVSGIEAKLARDSKPNPKRSAGDIGHEELASKRKRKLLGGGLGKTIFDDETHNGHQDAEFGFSLKSRSAVSTGGSKLTSVNSRGKSFFSPLKRNRGTAAT